MQWGASLSIKQCRKFGIDDQKVLRFALDELSLRRFRLMSYWNEIEATPGEYDFTVLDAQVNTIAKAKGSITLCLGARQPRWPESHWPKWALSLTKAERNHALFTFIAAVVERYENNPAVVSWQLENEALLRTFGEHGDFDRKRLRQEFKLVKELNAGRPIIMTTSTSWGIPLRRPIPDIVGFSFYNIVYYKGRYRRSIFQPWIFRLRARLIKLIWRRPSFIHELQAEPWGPKNIWEMSRQEQDKSMNIAQLEQNLQLAEQARLTPMDLWGLEWWYWRYSHGDTEIANVLTKLIS